MKKALLFISTATLASVSYAQVTEMWSDVPVLLDAFGHKISPDGSFSVGEAVSAQSAWGRDNVSGEIYFFDGASSGEGNCVTKDHIVVGTDKIYMKAAFLMPKEGEEPVLIPSLKQYSESYLGGINWDGTRLVGFLSNPSKDEDTSVEGKRMSYLPFYCDVIPETNTVTDPVFLPVPELDFFGLTPQYCTAFWISDDGTTILGQVIDNSGYYIYPIVYKQDASGVWDYSLPSEKLFNPNNLPVPHFPQPEIAQPLPQNYILNPEMKALYESMLDQFISGESEVNPNMLLNPADAGPDALMNEEEWEKYQKDLKDYEKYYNTVYENELNKYYDEFSRFIAQSTNFLQSSMAMNRAGTLIGQTKVTTRFSGKTPIHYENPVIFNLEDGTYKIYGDDLCELEISQILPDGTLIALYPEPGPSTPDLTPKHTYVCAPGSSNFVTIEDYIKASNPEYYQWYEEYLRHDVPIGYDSKGDLIYKDMVVTGLVAVSDDFTALSGGVNAWSWDLDYGDYYTYIFTNMVAPDAGIENIEGEAASSYKVFNLQGVKIMETKDLNRVNSLPKGIYIINGKKELIR